MAESLNDVKVFAIKKFCATFDPQYEEKDVVWFVAPRNNNAGWQQDILANGQDIDDHCQ